MDTKAILAGNMRALREARGWSQEELADRSGLHRTYISGVERQARNPTLAVMSAVATAFEISLAELVAA